MARKAKKSTPHQIYVRGPLRMSRRIDPLKAAGASFSLFAPGSRSIAARKAAYGEAPCL
ncbi:protein of unknown function [Aminobacter niigataensis]|nr:protein of unknown function [Aminobacter niigataensis]